MSDEKIVLDDDLFDWYDSLSEDRQTIIDYRVMNAFQRLYGRQIVEDEELDDEAYRVIASILKSAWLSNTLEKFVNLGLIEITGVSEDGQFLNRLTPEAIEALEEERANQQAEA